MPANVADEVDAHPAGPVVVQVAVQAERLQMALELAPQEWRGLAAAGVAGFLGAEQDEVGVWAGSGGEMLRGAAWGVRLVFLWLCGRG